MKSLYVRMLFLFGMKAKYHYHRDVEKKKQFLDHNIEVII